jgi:hypothetical protein
MDTIEKFFIGSALTGFFVLVGTTVMLVALI